MSLSFYKIIQHLFKEEEEEEEDEDDPIADNPFNGSGNDSYDTKKLLNTNDNNNKTKIGAGLVVGGLVYLMVAK